MSIQGTQFNSFVKSGLQSNDRTFLLPPEETWYELNM